MLYDSTPSGHRACHAQYEINLVLSSSGRRGALWDVPGRQFMSSLTITGCGWDRRSARPRDF
ncbi:hypothetical protein BaRGS_00033631, partial [Batillaria attramentaria]